MTIRKFFKLYDHYKNNFDLEMKLKKSGITYEEFNKLQIENEEWL